MDEKTILPTEKQKKTAEKINVKDIVLNGIVYNNPILAQTLGMCSALAITTSVINGFGMGLAVTFVLLFSNMVISLLRNFIPQKIRIAGYIIVIAGFVTIVDMITKAFFPSLSQSLGVFIPLIVVNCIILARAESFASKNTVIPSAIDGLANGVGFTLALVVVSAIREIIGNGTILGFEIMPEAYSPALLIVLPAGGFLVLGGVIALFQFLTDKFGATEKEGR